MQVEHSEIPLTGVFKGEAIVNYCEPLIIPLLTGQAQLEDPAYCGEMKASGSCKIQDVTSRTSVRFSFLSFLYK